jgi:UDP-N-acetylglucosamine--N-acetylmuramyl-(pentapeptide) pyrophosphoryl-undecaprenol N-acetylglucosamine transferase
MKRQAVVKSAPHILFVGGGTAGHIQPLFPVMKAVSEIAAKRQRIIRCSYVGLHSDLRSPLMKQLPEGCEVHGITAGKLNRFFTIKHVGQFGRLLAGLVQAERLITRLRPDVVFSKGGYVSIPIALAAKRRGIPIYSHETDVVPGMANRFVARYAKTVFTAFPIEAYTQIPQEKLRFVGQPIRSEFFSPKRVKQVQLNGRDIDLEKPVITIVGGSQGSHRLNELVQTAWVSLLEKAQVVQSTGPQEYAYYAEKRSALPVELQDNLWVVPFVYDELPTLFKQGTLAISRAGGTLAELAASGTPTILIPLSTAAQDHQNANAHVFAETGAAVVVDERKASGKDLENEAFRLLNNSRRRANLRAAIRRLAKPGAAEEIAKTLVASLP